jgi:hypothetical protein
MQEIPTLAQCLKHLQQKRDTLMDDHVHYGTDKTPSDYLHRAQTYITQYYNRHHPFDQDQTISLEDKKFSFDLVDGIKFSGVIDRLSKKSGDFVIIDYKTWQKLPTMQDTAYTEQLTLYAHGIRQKYRKYHHQIQAKLLYLHFDIEDVWVITDQSIDEVVAKYRQIIISIQDKATQYGFGDTQAFAPTEWAHCKFCPYRSICPLFNHIWATDIVLQESTIKHIVDTYVRQSKEITKLQYQKEQMRTLILSYLKQFPTLRLYGHQHRITITQMQSYTPSDQNGLKEILHRLDLLDQVLKIDPHALNRLIKNHTIDPQTLWHTVEKKQTTVLRSLTWWV